MIYSIDRMWLRVWVWLKPSESKNGGVDIHYESALVALWISSLTFSGLLTNSKAANERWIGICSPRFWMNGHINLLSVWNTFNLKSGRKLELPCFYMFILTHPSWCIMTILPVYEIYKPKCQKHKQLILWPDLSYLKFFPFPHVSLKLLILLTSSFIFSSTSPFLSVPPLLPTTTSL